MGRLRRTAEGRSQILMANIEESPHRPARWEPEEERRGATQSLELVSREMVHPMIPNKELLMWAISRHPTID